MRLFLIACLLLTFSVDSALGERKKRRRKKRKQIKSSEQMMDEAGNIDPKKAAEDELVKQVKSSFFPDWPQQPFGVRIAPILGLALVQNTDGISKTTTSSFEYGLSGGLVGIPLIIGNPGISLSPNAGFAKGSSASVVTNETSIEDKSSYKYERAWGGLDTVLYFKFYRHILGIQSGYRIFDTDTFTPTRSLRVKNDFGVLVLSWVSTHFTHNYLKAYSKPSDPFLVEQDNWLHARIFTSFLDFSFDFGPGVTLIDEFPTEDIKISGQSSYFAALSSANLFWKVGMSASAKYTYSTSKDEIGSYSSIKLPEEGLGAPRSTGAKEDSIAASIFFGIPNIAYGIGFGYRQNILVENYGEKNGTKRQTTRDQSLGAFVSWNL